ncbi:MAG: T9SS type A sorting domain-containing protein [Sphingobacteriales bacterium]|nr:MAG: T9SS type A sorting domain-containing protein [Sphingobacteriales bacterium]
MDKALKVYPIPTGNELNVFSTEEMHEIKIMDLTGNIVHACKVKDKKKNTIDIKELPENTYIVEVFFGEDKTSRSMFVKI